MDTKHCVFVAHTPLEGDDASPFLRYLPNEVQAEMLRLPARKRAGAAASRLLLLYLLREKEGLFKTPFPFSSDERGKPYFSTHPEVFLSLSHTKSAACAAVGDVPVGVDAETFRPLSKRLLERYFTEDERENIFSAPDRMRRAVEIWTRKEAYSKMDGRGLLLPFSSFSSLSDDGTIASETFDWYALSVSARERAQIFTEQMSPQTLLGYFSEEIVAKKD